MIGALRGRTGSPPHPVVSPPRPVLGGDRLEPRSAVRAPTAPVQEVR
ncbi:hypothetical protein [Saccharopolyspora gregorii]